MFNCVLNTSLKLKFTNQKVLKDLAVPPDVMKK